MNSSSAFATWSRSALALVVFTCAMSSYICLPGAFVLAISALATSAFLAMLGALVLVVVGMLGALFFGASAIAWIITGGSCLPVYKRVSTSTTSTRRTWATGLGLVLPARSLVPNAARDALTENADGMALADACDDEGTYTVPPHCSSTQPIVLPRMEGHVPNPPTPQARRGDNEERDSHDDKDGDRDAWQHYIPHYIPSSSASPSFSPPLRSRVAMATALHLHVLSCTPIATTSASFNSGGLGCCDSRYSYSSGGLASSTSSVPSGGSFLQNSVDSCFLRGSFLSSGAGRGDGSCAKQSGRAGQLQWEQLMLIEREDLEVEEEEEKEGGSEVQCMVVGGSAEESRMEEPIRSAATAMQMSENGAELKQIPRGPLQHGCSPWTLPLPSSPIPLPDMDLDFDTLQSAEWLARLGQHSIISTPACCAATSPSASVVSSAFSAFPTSSAWSSASGGCFSRGYYYVGGSCCDGDQPVAVTDLVRLHLRCGGGSGNVCGDGTDWLELLAARKTLLSRDVAVDALFEEEVLALKAAATSPFVVKLLGSCVCWDRLELFVEYAPGSVARELDAALKRRPQDPSAPHLLLPPARLRIIAASALRALAVLHAAEPPIAHMDLHPANLLLGGGGRVLLSGFGSAVRLLDRFSEDGELLEEVPYSRGGEDSEETGEVRCIGAYPYPYPYPYCVPDCDGSSGGGSGSTNTTNSHDGGRGAQGCAGTSSGGYSSHVAPCYLAPELLHPYSGAEMNGCNDDCSVPSSAAMVVVTTKADMYALGVLLSVCAVWHGSPAGVVARWQHGGAQLPACVPRRLRELVGRLMAEDPVQRPSAEEALAHPFLAELTVEELLI